MAYVTTNPPQKMFGGGIDGTLPSFWFYSSTDNGTTVDVPGYFTDAAELGIAVGDYIFVADSDASPIVTTVHRAVSYGGTTLTISTGDTFNTGTAGS